MKTVNNLFKVFGLYFHLGFMKACWSLVRLLILPFWKIEKMVPKDATLVDIGCGNGVLANYIAESSEKRRVIGIDLSAQRVKDAKLTIKKRKNVDFIHGDILKTKISKANCYLMVDVLHHMTFEEQIKLLKGIIRKLTKGSVLIIKDVDSSNTLPFIFGHIIEKLLYPKEIIYFRNKKAWEKILKSLKLQVTVTGGAFYFPDSTLIFRCTLK